MLRILIITALSLVALVALVSIIGLFFPRTHVATSKITLKQPLDSVYALVRDIGGVTAWWGGVQVSTRVTGVPGERWKQVAGRFSMELDVTDESAPLRFTTNIVAQKRAPFGGAWVYEFAPAGQGTTVSITEKGWIGPPPFRVIATITGLHKTMDGILVALAKHYGEDITPVHT